MLICMAAPDLDSTVTDSLQALLDEPQLSVLLGAGASMSVGLPDWDSLAVSVLCGSGVIVEPDDAAAFLSGQDPMLAVEAARSVLSDLEWTRLLRTALYPDAADLFPSALHRAVAQLAAQRDRDATRLFTLNFDTLLEDAIDAAFDEVGRIDRPFTRANETPRGGAGTIEVHHLHGVVPQDAPSAGSDPDVSVILGLSDFVSMPQASWQYSELQQALQRGPLVLAGTSYRDPDVRQWVWRLTAARADARVVALLARASMGLTREQFDAVRDALAAQWNSVGVEPILLHDHADSAQVMRELLYLDDLSYRPPRERAASIWQALSSDFSHLQKAHAEALHEDLQALTSVLGAQTNVTLWIADADGGLVRWSAPDRHYRSAHDLRVIPLGHDSPWIAGQCLAIDDILVGEPVDDPGGFRRWRSVVAAPVTVKLPGGPPFATAVLSSATESRLEDHDLDTWTEVLGECANSWTTRLETAAS